MKRGRRSKLDGKTQRQICKLLSEGIPVEPMCKSLGIAPATYYNWREKFVEFLDASMRARARGEIALLRRIMRDRDWRSCAWILERTHPERYGRVAERPLPTAEQTAAEKKVSIAVVLNTGGKSLEEVAHSPVRSVEEPPGKAFAETENEPPMEHWYNPVSRRIEPVEPIDNGMSQD